MARQLLTLDPDPLYRTVVFFQYSGPHGLPMQTYTDETTGQTYLYHRVRVFGPYEKPGPARAMIKREVQHAEKGYSNYCDYTAPMNQRVLYSVFDVQGIVQTGVPAWGLHV